MKLLILILHLILFLFYQVTGIVYETALKTFQFYKYIQFNYMKVKKKKTKSKQNNNQQNFTKHLCLYEDHTWLPSSFPWPWAGSWIMMLWCSGRTRGIWLFLFLLSFWRRLFWGYCLSFCITALHMKTEWLRIKNFRFQNKKKLFTSYFLGWHKVVFREDKPVSRHPIIS